MRLNKALRVSFALATLGSLLAGCSGAGSQATVPKAGASAPAAQAAGTALSQGSVTITLPANLQSVDRSGKTIPATAASVTVFVVQAPVGLGQPLYFPIATCVALPATGAGTTGIQFAAPVGNDFIYITLASGPCATATTLPASVVSAVNAAATTTPPTFLAPAGFANMPVIGTAGTGTFLNQVNAPLANPFVVNPGAGPVLGAITFGFSLGVPQSIVGGSLSTTTPSVRAIQWDIGAEGMPFTLGFTGPGSAGAVPPGTAFDFPVTVRLKDTSTTALGNAVPGALGLVGVTASGSTFTGTTAAGGITAGGTIATALGAPGCSPNQACATMTLNSSLPAAAQLAVVCACVSQDVYQNATITLTYNNQTLATIPITSQPQVVTLAQQGANLVLPAGNPSAGVNPLGPLGLTEAGDATTAGGSLYVADGPNVWWSGGTASTPFGTNQITFNAADAGPAGANFTAIADGGVYAAGTVFVADSACVACNNTVTGLWSRAANAAGLAQFGTPAGQSMFQSTVGPPFPIGPIGIAYWTVAGGAQTNGVLFVAANNSIYRVVLNTPTAATSVSLFAGTGIAGALGQGNANGPGLNSSFNFGTNKFVGMALDYNPNSGATAPPTTLYVVDPGNGVIRAISLTGTNNVSTLASAPAATGLAYDLGNGQLYVTNSNHTIAAINPKTGAIAGFAGQNSSSGTSNGLGLQAYPLQFNAGNAVSSTNGGIATQFSGIGLTPNTDAAAQAAAGVPNFLAKFSSPSGIVYDPTKSYFYVVDNGSAAIRTLP